MSPSSEFAIIRQEHNYFQDSNYTDIIDHGSTRIRYDIFFFKLINE